MLFPFILLMIIKKGLRMTDTIIGIISIGIAGLVMVFLLIKICGG
jgi:predicted membrane-bound spermidine synthase